MVEKRRYDSEEESLNGEAAYVAPSAQESSSDDEVLILPSKRVRAIESDDDDGDDGELEVDSDDPDGEPTKKKKKPKLKSTPPAPALKKPRKPAAAKKEGEATEKKEKKVKPKKDADGKNTRIVKVNTALYPAPETNPDTPIILPTTMQFLQDLRKPANNDRDWFKARDPIYRHAEQNWKSFIKALIPVASRADWSLPELPVKDVVGRIYRDVRFSKDKRPYKTHLEVSMTRTGRKGIFAGYYLQIGPNKSMFAAGAFQVAPSELATIRHSIITDSAPFRKLIAAPKFTKIFGKAVVGELGSIYGRDDELKTKPKIAGVGKDHPDIDLLKLKSFVVTTGLTNEQVLSDNFLATLYDILTIAAPFVQCVNEMILPTPRDDSDDEAAAPASAKNEEEDEAEDSGEEIPVESSDDGKKGEEEQADEEEEDDD